MRLGVHLRIASGLLEALDVAQELECEAIQIFSGNPNSWSSIPLNPELANKFAEKVRSLGIYPVVLHTPYLLNLASPDDDIWNKSRNALSDAVRKASMMGSDRVVTHIGSHKGDGYEKGIARICEAVKSSLDAAEGVAIALELGSGSGNSIGSTFEEIADIMRCLPDLPERIG